MDYFGSDCPNNETNSFQELPTNCSSALKTVFIRLLISKVI